MSNRGPRGKNSFYRCRNFRENGTRIRECAPDCRFVHPSDQEWETTPARPAPSRLNTTPRCRNFDLLTGNRLGNCRPKCSFVHPGDPDWIINEDSIISPTESTDPQTSATVPTTTSWDPSIWKSDQTRNNFRRNSRPTNNDVPVNNHGWGVPETNTGSPVNMQGWGESNEDKDQSSYPAPKSPLNNAFSTGQATHWNSTPAIPTAPRKWRASKNAETSRGPESTDSAEAPPSWPQPEGSSSGTVLNESQSHQESANDADSTAILQEVATVLVSKLTSGTDLSPEALQSSLKVLFQAVEKRRILIMQRKQEADRNLFFASLSTKVKSHQGDILVPRELAQTDSASMKEAYQGAVGTLGEVVTAQGDWWPIPKEIKDVTPTLGVLERNLLHTKTQLDGLIPHEDAMEIDSGPTQLPKRKVPGEESSGSKLKSIQNEVDILSSDVTAVLDIAVAKESEFIVHIRRYLEEKYPGRGKHLTTLQRAQRIVSNLEALLSRQESAAKRLEAIRIAERAQTEQVAALRSRIETLRNKDEKLREQYNVMVSALQILSNQQVSEEEKDRILQSVLTDKSTIRTATGAQLESLNTAIHQAEETRNAYTNEVTATFKNELHTQAEIRRQRNDHVLDRLGDLGFVQTAREVDRLWPTILPRSHQ